MSQSARSDSGSNQGMGPPPQTGAVCIANISPAERRKRLAFGIVTFAISLAVLAVLVASGASRWWRLPLVFLFLGAATGFFQWRDKT